MLKSETLYIVLLFIIVLTGCIDPNIESSTEELNSIQPQTSQTSNDTEITSSTLEQPTIDRKSQILTDPDFHYISDYLFGIKDEILFISKDSVNEFANQNLHGFGYLTKVHARHFAALEENPEAVAKLDTMAILAETIQRAENTEDIIEQLVELNNLIDELAKILNVNRTTSNELRTQKYSEELNKELQAREDVTVVEDPSICKREEVYCFVYEQTLNTIVEMKLDEAQMQFYNLMLSYQLPEAPPEGDEPEGYSGVVVYDNGYSFYKDSKMLFSAPGYSLETTKPTEDQYFGIVMTWVQLIGKVTYPGTFDTIEHAKSNLDGMVTLKQFAKDKVVLDWIEDTTEALEKYIESEEDEALRIEAWKQLNYLGNVVDVYMYENEFY
ncbi:MAG TPA: hypothetical protein VNR38_06855 [Ureibacillus sp.]|nr:hypothetical protein [Ureibacillus sp.]